MSASETLRFTRLTVNPACFKAIVEVLSSLFWNLAVVRPHTSTSATT